MIRTVIVLAAGGMVAGCYATASAPPPPVEAAPIISSTMKREDAYRAIVAERGRIWKDPYSIRDARAGTPLICPTGGYSVFPPSTTCVCLEVNAKNSMGGYTGIRRTIAYFPSAGGILTSDGGTQGYQELCNAMTPFPALNGS